MTDARHAPHHTTPASREAQLEARIAELERQVQDRARDHVIEARFRRFLDATDAGFCTLEMKFDASGHAIDYRFIETNAAFEEQTGLVDARGRWMREMVPQHEQHWFDIYGEVARTGRATRFENVADALGRYYDVHALQDGEPGQNRVAVLFIDITESRRAELALRDLTQKLEAEVAARTTDRNQLWTLSRDIMLRCQLDGEIVAVNPAWTTVLGWRESELIGANLYDLVHPEDIDATHDASDMYEQGEQSLIFENRYRTSDGAYRRIAWSVHVVRGIINAVGRDVTDERAKEETLRATEAQLRQSQKMEAVGQLTGGIAHDFNNLLTAIAASLQLLNFRVGRGQFTGVERYVSAAEGAVKRAAALTHRLLAFSRQQTLDPVPTFLPELTTDMEELIARTVGPRCELDVQCAADVWSVRIDRNQMESALLNLCINARDAMPRGGRIAVRVGNVEAHDASLVRLGLPAVDHVAVQVGDTGTGMTPDIAARAFDPFFTTKPQGQGTGLGLSMIYGFARQSGGHACIESTPGEGTTVSIYLPRLVGEDVQGLADEPVPIEFEHATPATILVVDDEDAIRMLLTEVLEEAGYRVLDAADAASAMSFIESNARLDLLITDIGLGGELDGHALATLAREKRAGLNVLFVTGHGDLAPEERVGRETYLLRKPFSMELLASTVENIMKAGADPDLLER